MEVVISIISVASLEVLVNNIKSRQIRIASKSAIGAFAVMATINIINQANKAIQAF